MLELLLLRPAASSTAPCEPVQFICCLLSSSGVLRFSSFISTNIFKLPAALLISLALNFGAVYLSVLDYPDQVKLLKKKLLKLTYFPSYVCSFVVFGDIISAL